MSWSCGCDFGHLTVTQVLWSSCTHTQTQSMMSGREGNWWSDVFPTVDSWPTERAQNHIHNTGVRHFCLSDIHLFWHTPAYHLHYHYSHLPTLLHSNSFLTQTFRHPPGWLNGFYHYFRRLFCLSLCYFSFFILTSVRLSWNVSAFKSTLNLCTSYLIAILSADLGPYVSWTWLLRSIPSGTLTVVESLSSAVTSHSATCEQQLRSRRSSVTLQQ